MAKNLAMAQAVREAVGENYTLMFDAFMGWSGKYAVTMAQELAPLRPYWLEEPVPPERVSTLRKIREEGGVPVATGEHVYTRWQTKELLVENAVDVLQNDPDWTGGISEQMKICALASAFETPVVAHGHSLLPPLHVAAAQSADDGAVRRVPRPLPGGEAGIPGHHVPAGAGAGGRAGCTGPGHGTGGRQDSEQAPGFGRRGVDVDLWQV